MVFAKRRVGGELDGLGGGFGRGDGGVVRLQHTLLQGGGGHGVCGSPIIGLLIIQFFGFRVKRGECRGRRCSLTLPSEQEVAARCSIEDTLTLTSEQEMPICSGNHQDKFRVPRNSGQSIGRNDFDR